MTPQTIRLPLACLLALLALLATGCAPRMKADVQAVSAAGYRANGQSYVMAPGPALSPVSGVTPDQFRQSTQRLRAVLTGHGYREVTEPESADLAVVVEWKVDGPHQVPDPMAERYSRPSFGLGIGYGSRPWYGGTYGRRYDDRWGGAYGGYGPGYGFGYGYGSGYGYPPPMTVVHVRTLSIEARDLKAARQGDAPARLAPFDQAASVQPGPSGAASAADRPLADPTPSGGGTAAPATAPAPTGRQQDESVPDYARPPYGEPIGTLEGFPAATELDGPVVWKVVVSSTGSSRDIMGALPALTVAASRWIGVTASVRVLVDDELGVTIQGQ